LTNFSEIAMESFNSKHIETMTSRGRGETVAFKWTEENK